MERMPHGIVERVDDGYVGYCQEAGVSARGNSLAEAFANLHAATWQALAEREQPDSVDATGDEAETADDVTYYMPCETDPNGVALAAMTAVLLDGLGEYESLNAAPAVD